MTALFIAAILCFLAAAVMLYASVRDGARREHAELIALAQFLLKYNGDIPGGTE